MIIAIAALGLRLASGPIQLTWLAPYVERALAPADRQVHFEVRDAELRLDDAQAIELVGVDVRAKGPDGEVLLELPEIEVGISLRALLTRGMLAPTWLLATAPRLVLARRADGTIGLRGLNASQQPAHGQIDLEALLAIMSSFDPSRPLSYLDRVTISGGQLVLEDQLTAHTAAAQNAELTIGRLADGAVAELVFELVQGPEPARVRTTGRLDAALSKIAFTLDVERLSAAELVRIEPRLPLAGMNLMLDGRLSGEVDFAGALSPLTFELRTEAGLIERPDLLAGPLALDSAEITGQIAADLQALTVTQARLVAKGAALDGTAEIAWRDRDLALRADLEAANVAARDLALFWPRAFGREARAWVVANITDGTVPRATAAIRLQPGDLDQRPIPESAVAGRFEFDDLTLRYFETLPPLIGVGGSATFTARRMDFAVARGHVDDLVVEDGNVAITGIGIKGRYTTQLEVLAHVAGPIEQAMALIDHPPLGFASDLGIAPAQTSGQARAELRIGTPLNREMDAAEVRVAATAELRDAGIAGLRGALDVSQGRFALKVDKEGADLAGEAAVNQVPLAIEWRENFADDAPFERRFHLQGTLDASAPQRLGLALSLPVQGSFGLDATLRESAGVSKVEVALDLTPLAIEAAALGWRKPADEAGRLTATLFVAQDGPLQVEAFELSSAELEATGSLELSLEPVQIERLVVSRLRAARTAASFDLRQQTGGGYEVSVRAETLDLDRVLEARSATGDDDAAPTPLTLTLIADRVLLGGQHGLSAVDAHLVRDRQGWRSADLHAALPKGGNVSLTLIDEGEQRRLHIASDDAGDLLQTLDQTTRIAGGRLELKARVARQVPALEAEGNFRIDQFTLLDAPLLARLLTVASLTGIGNLLGGEGIHFDRLELPFTLRDDLLAIDKGRLSGSQVGLTTGGQVDLRHKQIDLRGTIVPLYALNWAISKIPLVGPFLSGREGEGAFAVTYSVKGPLDQPQITVNPLSVLAPGFLRDLFSGIADGSLEPPVVPNPND